MLLAVVLVFVSAFLTNLLRLQVSALAYQRLASTPPYTVQMLSAFVLGFALSASPRSRKCALWIWVLPAVWILLALATWQPVQGASASVWQYFFTASWWQLSPSPLRSQWVTAQFMHTVPLFTSLAFTLGGSLRRQGKTHQQRLMDHPTAVA